MKIIICGKGGSGKSTIAALLARKMRGRGYSVLLVDADESNFALHRLAGLPAPDGIMESFGGKKGFKEKMNQAFPATDKPLQADITIDGLPEAWVTEADGIRLAVVGKIHDFGEGCACAMGMLSKMVLSKLIVGDNELVIVDTEAGIEHFGRRLDAESDLILGVIDPTYESVMMARKMTEMARSAESDIVFILNKTTPQTAAAMQNRIDPDAVAAQLPQDETLFMDSLEGNPLQTDLPQLDVVCDLIENRKKALRKDSEGVA